MNKEIEALALELESDGQRERATAALFAGNYGADVFCLLPHCWKWCRQNKWWRGFVDSWSILGAMIFCIAFAVSDEWHQSFVPDRFGTIQDVLIDGLGVCAAGSLMLVRQEKNSHL